MTNREALVEQVDAMLSSVLARRANTVSNRRRIARNILAALRSAGGQGMVPDRLRAALDDLQQAEAEYRLMHDRHGDGSQAAGRAWDLMRRAGNKARNLLAASPAPPEEGAGK